MTLKSIISIDVLTDQFDKFKATFDKYEQQVKNTNSAWAATAATQSRASYQTKSWVTALLTGKQYIKESADSARDQNKTLLSADKLWTSISKSAKTVVSSVAAGTRSLLHWSKILTEIGGLLGGGGLWGIDRIANNVSNQRQSAMGRGMSIGGQSAFRTYFERLGNPDQFLDMVNDIETDPRNWSSYALGVAKTGNADKDSVAVLKAMRARALATPTSQLGLLDSQYGTSVGEEYWRRLKDTPAGEFNDLVQKYQKNSGAMNVGNAGAWQNLKTTFGANWNKVSASFDTRLGQVAPNISKLSDSFTKLAISVINSPEVEKGLTAVGKWMDKLSDTISKPGFADKVETFIYAVGEGISKFIDGLEKLADALEKIASYLPGYDKGAGASATKNRFTDKLAMYEQGSNLPKGLLAYQFQTEASGSFNPKDTKDKRGVLHVGAFQFDKSTSDWLNKIHHSHLDPRNPEQAAVLADYYDEWLSQHYGGDSAKIIAGWNYGPGRLDALMKKYPKDWGARLPQETKDYITGAPVSMNAHAPGLVVTINNNTGGSAIVSSAPLAH